MAMQTASSPSAHGKTGSSGSIPYTLPASPTLTNPDMILPDYDDVASSPDRSQSPLMMWKSNQFDLNAQSFQTGPVTPTTPIIYGNGTMLSDIGEVTEAESTAGPVKLRMAARNGYMPYDVSVRDPPTMPVYEPTKKKKSEPRTVSRDRERRLSMESTSTITNGDQAGLFADFDDAVSMDDSNFQGDDEESVAELYYDEASAQGNKTPPANHLNGISDPGAEERYSTALSRRAEQILANAKRRLTTMEGNLSRARSSLSSADSDSTPSPTFPRPMTAVHREHDSGLVKSQRGHNRISSENNIANDPKPTVLHSPRASSALGAAGGYRQPLQSSQGVDHTRESPKNGSPRGNPMYGNAGLAKSKSSLLQEGKHTLEPLSEDDVPDTMGSARPSLEDARLDSFLSPTFGSFPEQGLRRSASVSQMRDLKDQMNDLKGRLSTLRDQARADSMKRRSMQSLRTPSPFTHAREWYTEKNDDHIDTPIMSDVSRWSSDSASLHEVNVMSNEDRALAEPRDDSSLISTSVYSDHETSPQTKLSPADSHHSPGETTPNVTPSAEEDENGDSDDMKTEDGYQDDTTELEDDTSESGESSYEDSVQNQVSHEDREDAFDYEHFFLHSAMGSMSQKRLRRKDSQNSFSSEESVETTRGPTATNSAGEGTRGRRGSNASTSTMESFATATEGRTTRVDNNSTGYFPEQIIEAPERSRSHTPDTAKKTAFGLGSLSSDSNMDRSQPRASVIRRPQSSAATFMHRPSVSSMGSTGTNRSFPLVNRPKTNGILTPGVSPDQELKQISETLMSETASICDRESVHSGDQTIEMLQKEDQILVERLVASLGRCVLGLTESGRASTESRLFRRRIETARQILEGLEQPT